MLQKFLFVLHNEGTKRSEEFWPFSLDMRAKSVSKYRAPVFLHQNNKATDDSQNDIIIEIKVFYSFLLITLYKKHILSYSYRFSVIFVYIYMIKFNLQKKNVISLHSFSIYCFVGCFLLSKVLQNITKAQSLTQ